MKKKLIGAVVPLACVISLTQCSDLLDTQPLGELNTETFYRTPAHFDAATLGAYSTLLNFSWSDAGYFPMMLRVDDDTRGPWDDGSSNFEWTAGSNHVELIWREAYKGIQRSNMILAGLEDTDQLSEEQKARYAGEAKFVRAFFNFMLLRHFENVALVTAVPGSIEETRVEQSPPAAVWDQIEQDLEDAAAGLSGQNLETGRATEWAAKALLGKVEVYRAQWENRPEKYSEAIVHLEDVLAKSGAMLVTNFCENFLHATENNAESLFEIQMSAGDNINGWSAVDSPGGYASAGSNRQIRFGASQGQNGLRAPGGWDYAYGSTQITIPLQNAFEVYGSAERTIQFQNGPRTVTVYTRDPRAYCTMYSLGEKYATSGTLPYDTAWATNGSVTPAKYIRPFVNEWNTSKGQMNQSVSLNNERVLRLADVILTLAEAHALAPNANASRAAELVNMVRERARESWDYAYGSESVDADLYAGIPRPANLLPDVPAGAGAGWVRQYIIPERRVELALEAFSGGRFDDIVRWIRGGILTPADFGEGMLIDFGEQKSNANFDPAVHIRKPIPQDELDLNPNLVQNTGY